MPDSRPEPTQPEHAPNPGILSAAFDVVLRDELVWVEERRRQVCLGQEPPLPAQERDLGLVLPPWDASSSLVVEASAPGSPAGTAGTKSGDTGQPPEPEGRVDLIIPLRKEAIRNDMVGLAFSGGGIRSATFNLGILQGLASLKLLRLFDYLSTVSGGGYIGGWLAAWIKREGETPTNPAVPASAPLGPSAVANVERQLDPNRVCEAKADRLRIDPPNPEALKKYTQDAEPEPLHHLRAYSRYLSPWIGLFSLDLWTLVAIYLRNLFISLLVSVPLIMAVVLLARGLIGIYHVESSVELVKRTAVVLCFLLLLAALAVYRVQLSHLRLDRGGAPEGRQQHAWLAIIFLFLATVVAAWCVGISPNQNPNDPKTTSRLPTILLVKSDQSAHATLVGQMLIAAWGAFCLVAAMVVHWRNRRSSPGEDAGNRLTTFVGFLILITIGSTGLWSLPALWDQSVPDYVRVTATLGAITLILGVPANLLGLGMQRKALWLAICSVIYGLVLGLLVGVLTYRVLWHLGGLTGTTALFVTFGPPVYFLALLIAGYVEVALAGSLLSEHEREWRSRFGALLLVVAVFWLAFFGTTLWLPWLLLEVFENPTWKWSAAVAWLGATVTGMLTFRNQLVGQPAGKASISLRLVARIVPPVFLVGFFALVAVAVAKLPSFSDSNDAFHRPTDFLAGLGEPRHYWGLIWFGICLGVGGLFLALAKVNHFSLHSLYANRLTRCYLGASRRKPEWHPDRRAGMVSLAATTAVSHDERRSNQFTGFDDEDDFSLCELSRRRQPTIGPPYRKAEYYGPYPLFNTTLNLVGGTELALQDRKGESFTLTPDYCGSDSTGYGLIPWDDLTDQHLTLGRAIAISGAAVDPNMREYQSATLTAMLTLLNVRMGWWLQNPAWHDPWTGEGPQYLGGRRLLDEFRGNTTADQAYIHLSDGGHFDNTGVYELVRRRCRYIVYVDAAEDVSDASENLTNLIRLCRTDFGVRIDIDTTPIRKGPDRRSQWHCAIGAIRYDEIDPEAVVGTFVFIRPSLTGDEPADVRNYAENNTDFPHHSTMDQFFDGAQFESYRELGFHIARVVFEEAAEPLRTRWDPRFSSAAEYQHAVRHFFSDVRRRWFPPPPEFTKYYTQAAEQCLDLVKGMRDKPELIDYTLAMYPELRRRLLTLPLPQGRAPEPAAARSQAVMELQTVNQTLQVMELAWMGIHLEGFHAHPLNRGWMNALRRWTATPAFQAHWPTLRGEYSRDFVRFCEMALHVDKLPVKCVPAGKLGDGLFPLLAALDREFHQEWATVLQIECAARRELPDKYLTHAAARSIKRWGNVGPPVWLLTHGTPGTMSTVSGDWEDGDHPYGVVLLDPGSLIPAIQVPMRLAYVPELLVWIRGAHRTLEMGREALPLVLKVVDLAAKHLDIGGLVVRYPKRGAVFSNRLQRILWAAFFQDHDFYRGPNETVTDGTTANRHVEYETLRWWVKS